MFLHLVIELDVLKLEHDEEVVAVADAEAAVDAGQAAGGVGVRVPAQVP